MTDAQYLFDLAAKQYNETAEVLERHFETVADQIRGWGRLPQKHPPPPPPRRLVPLGALSRLQSWALRHRALSAAMLAFVGSGAVYFLIQRHSFRQKRRAKRTPEGARTEVVVVAGSAESPLTIALAIDLERRGYIVYITTSSSDEDQRVRSQLRADILPLHLDLVYPDSAQEQVTRVHEMLSRHHFQISGTHGHRLSLAGVIVMPDDHFQSGILADVSAESWSNALNAKVLKIVLTTQALLPLVQDFSGRVLLLTPSIIPSLNPAGHIVQSTVFGALSGFSASLAAELRLRNIPLCTFKLGHLQLPGGHSRSADGPAKSRGTPLRQLHDSVFDALQARRPARTWHVGRGSLVYDLVGQWVPAGIIGWAMGLSRPRERPDAPVPRVSKLIEASDVDSSEGSAQWERVDDSDHASSGVVEQTRAQS